MPNENAAQAVAVNNNAPLGSTDKREETPGATANTANGEDSQKEKEGKTEEPPPPERKLGLRTLSVGFLRDMSAVGAAIANVSSTVVSAIADSLDTKAEAGTLVKQAEEGEEEGLQARSEREELTASMADDLFARAEGSSGASAASASSVHVTHHYVHTCPAPDTILRATDKVFVLTKLVYIDSILGTNKKKKQQLAEKETKKEADEAKGKEEEEHEKQEEEKKRHAKQEDEEDAAADISSKSSSPRGLEKDEETATPPPTATKEPGQYGTCSVSRFPTCVSASCARNADVCLLRLL